MTRSPERIGYRDASVIGAVPSAVRFGLTEGNNIMRIALINPVARRCQGYHTIGSFMPQLGLQVLAKLVPAPHTVDIIDDDTSRPTCITQTMYVPIPIYSNLAPF